MRVIVRVIVRVMVRVIVRVMRYQVLLYAGLWTESRKWLGRFFGFSPKSRSVSVV